MFVIGCIFVFFSLSIFNQTLSLVTLPAVEDNDILTAEAAIRSTANTIFYLFHLRRLQQQPKIKQYATIHKYFISLTLQDYDSLKQIAKLTRVDKKNIENVTADFIALINEILDEDNEIKIEHLLNGDAKVYDIENELEKIEYLKNSYAKPDKALDVNLQILKILEDESKESPKSHNSTSPSLDLPLLSVDNETIPDNEATWREDDYLRSGRRIYNGFTTRIHHYPFMASVQIFGRFQCGSSIIKSDLVITAASCLQLAWNNRFYRENPAFLSVRVGSTFYESGGDSIAVLEVYFYPTYNPRNLHNNLAIMRLIRQIRFKRRVKKIEMDKEEHALPTNVDGVGIIGWGARTTGNILHNAFSNRLHYSVLDVYPLADCQDVYSKDYVTSKNFCAGYISKGNGACNRDVGGPGVVGGRLAGVISFGAPVCGTPDAPTVFTKIGYYTDWIEEIVEQDVPQTKKRTTLLPHKYYYQSPSRTHRKKKTQWTLEPVRYNDKNHEEVILSTTKSERPTKKKKSMRNLDKGMFKEFLKTMFESEEIQEYIDLMRETAQPVGATAAKLVTKYINMSTTFAPIDYGSIKATRMIEVEPTTVPSSDEDDQEENMIDEEFLQSMTIMANPEIPIETGTESIGLLDAESSEMTLQMTDDDEEPINDADKELEEQILKLAEKAASQEKEGTTAIPQKHWNNKHSKLQHGDLESFSNTNNKDEAMKDRIDQAILTLLYLSDEGDKDRNNSTLALSALLEEVNKEGNNEEFKEDHVTPLKEKTKLRKRKKKQEATESGFLNYESEKIPLQTVKSRNQEDGSRTFFLPKLSFALNKQITHKVKHKGARMLPNIVINREQPKTYSHKRKLQKKVLKTPSRERNHHHIGSRLHEYKSETLKPNMKQLLRTNFKLIDEQQPLNTDNNLALKAKPPNAFPILKRENKGFVINLLQTYVELLNKYKKNVKNGEIAPRSTKNPANYLDRVLPNPAQTYMSSNKDDHNYETFIQGFNT